MFPRGTSAPFHETLKGNASEGVELIIGFQTFDPEALIQFGTIRASTGAPLGDAEAPIFDL